jgi:hypothetical protein
MQEVREEKMSMCVNEECDYYREAFKNNCQRNSFFAVNREICKDKIERQPSIPTSDVIKMLEGLNNYIDDGSFNTSEHPDNMPMITSDYVKTEITRTINTIQKGEPVPKEAEYEDTGMLFKQDNGQYWLEIKSGRYAMAMNKLQMEKLFPDLKEGETIELYRRTKGDDKE